MKKLLLILLMTIAYKTEAQTNIYVDSAVSTSGTGSSWATAYKTLGEALNVVNTSAATSKFVVNVAKGTYYPTGSRPSYVRDSAFMLSHDGVKLLGGYPSGGGTRNAIANQVILSGNIGTAADSSDNSFHIMVIVGINSNDTVVVDGFRMTAARGNSFLGWNYNAIPLPRNQGAGLNANGNKNHIYIKNCRFDHNKCTDYRGSGAGIFSSASVASLPSPTTVFSLSNCMFDNNSAVFGGGGVYLDYEGCTYSVDSCTFLNNSAGFAGGLMNDATTNQFVQSIFRLSASSFSNNTATYTSGGGMYNQVTSGSLGYGGGDFRIASCNFTGNTATGNGGGLLNIAHGTTNLVSFDNCLFSSNAAGLAGGGAYIDYGSVFGSHYATTNFNKCSFLANTANKGGGMGIDYDEVLNLYGCTLENNIADLGGGMHIEGTAHLSVDSCRIRSNSAVSGGGIYNFIPWNGPMINHSIISGNIASQKGGGMFNYSPGSGIGLVNTLFSGNYAAVAGGAVYDTLAGPGIVNCTFSGDSAQMGRGLYNTNGSSPNIVNCIIWEGTSSILNNTGCNPSVTYSTIQGGYAGTGNSGSNPQFLAPLSAFAAPTVGGSYFLSHCSPAIDAGTTIGSFTATTTDLAGYPRLNGSTYDQGAYEYHLPGPSGTDTICTGATVQLKPYPPGGTWSSTNPSVAGVSSAGIVNAVAPGSDTIIYIVGTTCRDTARKRIVVAARPTVNPIVGAGNVCMNSTITLTNATSGGIWNSVSVQVATISGSGVVTPVLAGTDTIRYVFTNAAGCSDTASKVITVDPLDISTIQTGPLLTANQAGAIYQWIDCGAGNITIAGQTGQSYTATSNGQYAVVVTLGACRDTSTCMTVSGLAISELEKIRAFIHVYPNPVSDMLTISVDGSQPLRKIVLSDMVGRQLLLQIPASTKTMINLSGFPTGLYQLQCEYDKSKIVSHISIAH